MPIVVVTSENIDKDAADDQADGVRQRGVTSISARIRAADGPLRPSPRRMTSRPSRDATSMTRRAESRASRRAAALAIGVAKSFDRTRALAGADLELAVGRDPRPAGRQRRRQVDPVEGHHRPRQPGRRRDRLSRRAAAPALDARRARAGIAIVMQETSLAPDLSVPRTSSCRSSAGPGASPIAAPPARAGELLAALGQEDTPAARRRGAPALRRAAPARRDRQGARRRREAHHLRRADRLAQPRARSTASSTSWRACATTAAASSSSRIGSRRCSRSPTASP